MTATAAGVLQHRCARVGQPTAGEGLQGVIASARDGNLRLSIHVYDHEDDIERLITTLGALDR